MAKKDTEEIRAFVAIELPGELIERLRKLQQELGLDRPGISRTKPENIHLTLKFLGNIAAERAEEVGEALEKVGAKQKPFVVSVGGIGAFPSLKRPRVLWVGIRESAELKELFRGVEEVLARVGFEREDRPFHPHLTLCRIRSPEEALRLSKRASSPNLNIEASFQVKSLKLFRSRLRPTGAEYTVLRTIELGEGAPGK